MIRNNTFQNSNVGIASASSSTVISKNTFLNIKEAIVIESGKVSVELNAFVDNGKNVRNLSKSPISANFNWWGTSDPHDIRDKLEGPVDWSIFLMSDPTVLDIPFALEQNFPNPFNSTTIIHYQIPATTSITRGGRALLVIYDILGQKVKTLVDEDPLPGFHSVFWDARDDKGRKVSSGVYFYRLTGGAIFGYQETPTAKISPKNAVDKRPSCFYLTVTENLWSFCVWPLCMKNG